MEIKFSNETMNGQHVDADEPQILRDEKGIWWHYKIKDVKDKKGKVTHQEMHYLKCIEHAGLLVAVIPPVVKIVEKY
ncbi:MAG TPA: hypothetical protein PLP33_24705 [Leptospiraceae bacterium]|nr:hypothetical protein [Leptospiraceae bacterium]